MGTGVLFLMLVLLTLLLAAFIYQIATTPVKAVDAPTLVRSAAAASAAAPALPVRRQRGSRIPAATRPAHATAARGTSRRLQSWTVAALAIAGLAAALFGGWLFLHIAPGAAACVRPAFEVCSQGFVLLTGTQLAGGAVAAVGMGSIVVAIVLALR